MSIRRARARGCRASVATISHLPATMPAWGPPRSLSPEKRARSAPAAMLSWGMGSWVRPKLAVSSRQPLPRSWTTGRPRSLPSAHELVQRRGMGEAGDAEVGRVHLQQGGGLRRHGVAVVAGVGAVGRADLHQRRAGLAHDVGDAEAAADLDGLAARDDDLSAVGDAGEREQQRRRVVVDHQRSLGAGEGGDETLDAAVAGAPRALVDVVLEVGVALGGAGDGGLCIVAERGAAQVGVDDDAGGVDDGRGRGSPEGVRGRRHGLSERVDGGRGAAAGDGGSCAVELASDEVRDRLAGKRRQQPLQPRMAQEPVHAGQAAKA